MKKTKKIQPTFLKRVSKIFAETHSAILFLNVHSKV